MSYKLKARYLGDSIIITVKHPCGEYNKKIINVHQQIANKTIDFKKTQTSHEEIENQLENITPNLTPYNLGQVTNGYMLEIAGY